MNNSKLLEPSKSAIDYNKSIIDALDAIVRPFVDSLGLTHFSYTRYTQGNKYFSVSLDPAMVEAFFAHSLDKHILPEQYLFPENHKSSMFWDLLTDYEPTKFMASIDYAHGYSTYVRNGDFIESMHFATNPGNNQQNKLYMSRPDLFERFFIYFKDKARDLIHPNDEKTLFKFRDDAVLNLNKTLGGLDHTELSQTLIASKFEFRYQGRRFYLTLAELETLQALSSGMSMKMIGRALNKSPRTVESHLNNIKDKSMLLTREDILKLYQDSVYSAILPR
jgi:DNA-binding CsgD family transcriptional regulator